MVVEPFHCESIVYHTGLSTSPFDGVVYSIWRDVGSTCPRFDVVKENNNSESLFSGVKEMSKPEASDETK